MLCWGLFNFLTATDEVSGSLERAFMSEELDK